MRDRRRRPTPDESRFLYERAGGKCQRCGVVLDATWHAAHLVAWSHGGATSVENMEAWCRDCNLRLGDRDAIVPEALELRVWQEEALPTILERLYETGQATLQAAPGAGKTIFAGLVFKWLAERDLVQRVVVVVPNLALVDQWQRVLQSTVGVSLDHTPRGGYLEHPDTAGCVITYATMRNAAASQRVQIDNYSTLVVFDEVHHLGEDMPWGQEAEVMVGTLSGLAATVLNMTGTLFRSEKNKRIPMVRYRDVNHLGRPAIEAVADYSVTPKSLLDIELRRVDLYAYGSQVEWIDLLAQQTFHSEVANLTGPSQRAIHAELIADPDWMEGFAQLMGQALLEQQQALGDPHPFKALWIAKDQTSARDAAAIIRRQYGEAFVRLVISDEGPAARADLRRAAAERVPLCIVAVQMVTEGFDCPDIAVIAYASNYIAELFVTQMVARAMRITRAERDSGMVLSARVLIPDVADLRAVFADILVEKLHMLTPQTQPPIPPASQQPAGPGVPRIRPYRLVSVTAPELGEVDLLAHERTTVAAADVKVMLDLLKQAGLPSAFAARLVDVSRQWREQRALSEAARERQRSQGITATPMNPRQVNIEYRSRASRRAKWWHHQGDPAVPVDHFYVRMREAGGYEKIDQASADQLRRAVHLADAMIRTWCDQQSKPVPRFVDESDV